MTALVFQRLQPERRAAMKKRFVLLSGSSVWSDDIDIVEETGDRVTGRKPWSRFRHSIGGAS